MKKEKNIIFINDKNKQIEKKRKEKEKYRKKILKIKVNNINFILIFISILFLIIFYRLFILQVVDQKIIKEQSDKKMTSNIVLNAKRGNIIDRNGKILATSIRTYYMVITHEPYELNNEAIKFIEKYTNLNIENIKQELLNSKSKYAIVAKNLEKKEIENLFNIYNPNIGIYEMETRYYPYKTLAAQVIGFLNNDGNGNCGLEYQFNNELKGEDGYIRTKSDSVGRKLAHSNSITYDAKNGINLQTTIDINIQYFVQEAIEIQRELIGANKITAIIQQAKTGEILAMATSPSFDLNNPREIIDVNLKAEYDNAENNEIKNNILQKMWRNPNISDTYEPGSTFKIFTGAVGIEENIINKNSTFNCNGITNIEGSNIKCWVYPRKHGLIDLTHAYMDSCNIAFIDTALKLKKEKFYNYIDLFQLNKKTGIELPGEVNSILLKSNKLKNSELARMGFGHSMSYTPIQMLNIINIVSNNGVLTLPTIIKNEELKSSNKLNVTKVLSESTSEQIKDMLEETVSKGNAKRAKIDGYRIGGKTGTSIKIKNGKYDRNATDSSFVAIAPIDAPEINLIIVVDEAKDGYNTGSATAIIAKDILYKTFNYLNIEPSNSVKNETIVIKNYIGKSIDEAKKLADSQGIKLNIIDINQDNKNKFVKKQYPLEGNLFIKNNELLLIVE